jgi:hypothetical protein
MSKQRYTSESKDEAARQIVGRGYSVADLSVPAFSVEATTRKQPLA